MKKSFVTVMPNHIGAFLEASRCFASLGINITRVSYNKAVDSHMLFLDAEGSPEQLALAAEALEKIGYLPSEENRKSVVLLEFRLRDVPGSVTDVLELISKHRLNLSYLNSRENGTGYQCFQMGIVSEPGDAMDRFLADAQKLCAVRVIPYNHADRVFDNSFFYTRFTHELADSMQISEASREALLVYTNLAMQQLDESGVSPYRTFDSISRFCELLSKSRGDGFRPRVTTHHITDATDVILIEPPCGSNTAILRCNGRYLFVDSGYAYCQPEMFRLFHTLIPNFDRIEKQIFVTHADVDHCGLLPWFDTIYASPASAECLRLEYEEDDGFRERNPLHKPYIRICKLLTSYLPPDPKKVRTVSTPTHEDGDLVYTGSFSFGDLQFEHYEGMGGHLRGESVLIDYTHHVVFSGDVFVNMKEMTPEQAEYNRYAPILMTSVDTDPGLCAQERKALLARLGTGDWQIFGGHGAKKAYSVRPSD